MARRLQQPAQPAAGGPAAAATGRQIGMYVSEAGRTAATGRPGRRSIEPAASAASPAAAPKPARARRLARLCAAVRRASPSTPPSIERLTRRHAHQRPGVVVRSPAPTRQRCSKRLRALARRHRACRRIDRAAPANCARCRCASSTAALPSPTGCRRWRSASACWAWRPAFSAQVLARRKEFGLLAHLGLTRAQILAVVAGEGAAWLAAGALVGLALGLAVSVVLVHVVNPQSFHWTMELLLPWGELLALCAAVVVAGIGTAAWRRARRRVARRGAGGEGGLVMRRRDGLLAALLATALRLARQRRRRCARGRALRFPRDHGAHLGAAHRVVVRHRPSCAAPASSADRLPDHVLPQPHRPGEAVGQPLRGAAVCCSRMPR